MLYVHLTLTLLSVTLTCIAAVMYLRDVLKGRIRPHTISRIAVAVVLLMTFIGTLVAQHGRWEASTFLAFFYAALGLIVLELIRQKQYGMGEWTLRTGLCLGGAVSGGVLLVVFRSSPQIGMIAAIAADLVAYWPTFGKTWAKPESEKHATYTLSAIGAACALGAEGVHWASLFSLYLVGLDGLMVVIIFHLPITEWMRRPKPKKAM